MAGTLGQGTGAQGLTWPLDVRSITRVGDTVTDKRPGSGRPHRGVDLFAAAGTAIIAASAGVVSKIVDGRFTSQSQRKRAGLYIDVSSDGGIIFRYLHLGSVYVAVGDRVNRGKLIADIAPAYTSGAEKPHLHFEMRVGLSREIPDGYGKPLDPLKLLPPRNA